MNPREILISYLQSLLKSIVHTMLEIAVVSAQGLNLTSLVRRKKVASPERVRENTGFREKNLGEFVLSSQK